MTFDTGHDEVVELGARPYLVTGGRTRARQAELGIESVVVRSPSRTMLPQSFERARILDLVDGPLSVAEIAARLRLPFTVVLVVVGDLVADGVLLASEPSSAYREDIGFLERLISGVAAL